MWIDGSFIIRFVTYSRQYSERECTECNIRYTKSHSDGFLATKWSSEILILLLRNGDVSRTMSLAHSLAVYLQQDRQQQLHRKKFGGLTRNGSDQPSGLELYDVSSRLAYFSPLARELSYLPGRFYATWIVIVDIGRISVPWPSYSVTRFSSFACIRNLGRAVRPVLFDFTFAHLFPAAASWNCKFSGHSAPWLKSILRDSYD